jgi:hypothetical protein
MPLASYWQRIERIMRWIELRKQGTAWQRTIIHIWKKA